MQKNQLAVQEALTWLDTPYHHQGRDVWKPTSWNYSARITQATAEA